MSTAQRDRSEKIGWLFVIFSVFAFLAGGAYDMQLIGVSCACASITVLSLCCMLVTYLNSPNE